MKTRTYNKFTTMGYNINCKICQAPIHVGDKVESKSGGRGPKLYHAECYDSYHLEFDDDHTIKNGYGDVIRAGDSKP